MKQNKGIKYYLKNNKIFLLLGITLITVFFMGCTFSRTDRRTDLTTGETLENMHEPLRVFYDGTGDYLLKSYMFAHPEVKIELVNCIPNVDGEIDINSLISKNGVPDLIIAREEVSMYLPTWYKDGYIAEMGELCSNDESLEINEYFPETFEIFKNEEGILAVPLGITMDFMLVSESKFTDLGVAGLEKGYTGRELLNVMLEEVQKDKQPGEFFSETNLPPMVMMYYLNGLTQTDDGVKMDEELFKQVYEFVYRNSKVADEARSFWNEQGKDFGSGSGYLGQTSLDPRRYEGNFKVSFWGGGHVPALVLSYAETSYQYFVEEGIKAVYFPTADDGSDYKARVKVWGAIAEDSNRKQLAYDLLRALMDEDVNEFGNIQNSGAAGAGILNVNIYPIKIENALSYLDRYENQTIPMMMYTTDVIIERSNVGEEEKEKHKEVLTNISGLFCWASWLDEIDDIFYDYCDANIEDYKNCYLDMLNSLNADVLTENIADISTSNNEKEESLEVAEVDHDVSDETNELKERIRNTEIGDTFFLGKTEQDDNLSNGPEPIEWIVLEKNEDNAFVISKKILEWLTFSKNDGGKSGVKDVFTWDLDRNQQRTWLTNELYHNGFSEFEKEIILVTHSEDDILSYEEYDDYLYVPSKEDVEKYMPDINMRKAEMTVYVAEKANQIEGELGCWSLRSILVTEDLENWKYTRQINEDGEFGAIYTTVPNGVRPVMWLDIS